MKTRFVKRAVFFLILSMGVTPLLFGDDPCTYLPDKTQYGTCLVSCPGAFNGMPCDTWNGQNPPCSTKGILNKFNPDDLTFACALTGGTKTKCQLSMDTKTCVTYFRCVYDMATGKCAAAAGATSCPSNYEVVTNCP